METRKSDQISIKNNELLISSTDRYKSHLKGRISACTIQEDTGIILLGFSNGHDFVMLDSYTMSEIKKFYFRPPISKSKFFLASCSRTGIEPNEYPESLAFFNKGKSFLSFTIYGLLQKYNLDSGYCQNKERLGCCLNGKLLDLDNGKALFFYKTNKTQLEENHQGSYNYSKYYSKDNYKKCITTLTFDPFDPFDPFDSHDWNLEKDDYNHISLSPDKSILICSSSNADCIDFYDVEKRALVKSIKTQVFTDTVAKLSFDNSLIIYSSPNSIKIYDFNTTDLLNEIPSEFNSAIIARITKDNKYLIMYKNHEFSGNSVFITYDLLKNVIVSSHYHDDLIIDLFLNENDQTITIVCRNVVLSCRFKEGNIYSKHVSVDQLILSTLAMMDPYSTMNQLPFELRLIILSYMIKLYDHNNLNLPKDVDLNVDTVIRTSSKQNNSQAIGLFENKFQQSEKDKISNELIAQIAIYKEFIRNETEESILYINHSRIKLWNKKIIILKAANDLLNGKIDALDLKSKEMSPGLKGWEHGDIALYKVNKVKIFLQIPLNWNDYKSESSKLSIKK